MRARRSLILNQALNYREEQLGSQCKGRAGDGLAPLPIGPRPPLPRTHAVILRDREIPHAECPEYRIETISHGEPHCSPCIEGVEGGDFKCFFTSFYRIFFIRNMLFVPVFRVVHRALHAWCADFPNFTPCSVHLTRGVSEFHIVFVSSGVPVFGVLRFLDVSDAPDLRILYHA